MPRNIISFLQLIFYIFFHGHTDSEITVKVCSSCWPQKFNNCLQKTTFKIRHSNTHPLNNTVTNSHFPPLTPQTFSNSSRGATINHLFTDLPGGSDWFYLMQEVSLAHGCHGIPSSLSSLMPCVLSALLPPVCLPACLATFHGVFCFHFVRICI